MYHTFVCSVKEKETSLSKLTSEVSKFESQVKTISADLESQKAKNDVSFCS